MSAFGMTIDGVKQIEKKLRNLETRDKAKACKSAARETQKEVILPQAKSNAQAIGGIGNDIASKMGVRVMTKMQRGHYGVKVIIRPTEHFVHITADGIRHYIPSAIEYGHAFPGRGGKNAPKDVKPRPFMRKAYEEKRTRAIRVMGRKVVNKIESAVK